MYKQYLDTAYDIYDDGKCFSHKSNKFLKGSISSGYLTYAIVCNDGSKKNIRAHRMVAQMFIPNPDDLPVVNHKDGDKMNNKVENLEWVTVQQNNQHARDMNLVPKHQKWDNEFDGSLEGEEWKVIPNFPNYSVSNMGRVMNRKTYRLKKITKNANGYCYTQLCSKEKGNKQFYIHRLVYSTFKEEIVEPYVITHIDGTFTNNCLSNLKKVLRVDSKTHSIYDKDNSEKTSDTSYIVQKNIQAVPVNQIDVETGKIICTYPSITEAQKATKASRIPDVLKGVRKYSSGFRWERAEIK